MDRLDQTKLDLETAQEARDVAAQAARISPGTVSRVELARLNIAPQKLKRELQSLKEQLSLYEYKLKLLTSRENAKEIQTEERAPSKSKPVRETSSPDRSSRGKKQTRYNGKDFDTWAEESQERAESRTAGRGDPRLASFGAHGLGAQATELILSNASGYTTDLRLYSRELTTAAFQAFQWIPVKDSLPRVQRALKSEVESERLFAMQVVTAFHSNHADIPKLLLPMLKDPQPAVRQAAANTLLTYDPNVPELTQILREWLASDDTNQVMFAVHAITNTGQGGVNSMNRKRASDQKLLSDMMPDLLALLDRDEPIKTDVRKALLDMPDTCRPALEEAVKSENEITRRHAEAMLKEYVQQSGTADSTPPHRRNNSGPLLPAIECITTLMRMAADFLFQVFPDLRPADLPADSSTRSAATWPAGGCGRAIFCPRSARSAVELEVNPMTVSKAYSLLERDGVVELVRGQGMRIAERATGAQRQPARAAGAAHAAVARRWRPRPINLSSQRQAGQTLFDRVIKELDGK